MGDNNHLNLYDFFGFPDFQQREEARKVFNIEGLRLKIIENTGSVFFDPFFERYQVWSMHIDNFSRHLGLHLLLLHYQYLQEPLDVITIEEFQSPAGARKIFFDTFAEDVSVSLISYFDKQLEMFNELFSLDKGEKGL